MPSDPSRDDVIEVVRSVARALDADDFARVAALLADDCVYDTGRGVLRGPEAIVASYAEATAWGRRHSLDVRFEHTVESADGDTVSVRFIDHLAYAGRRHVHECRQTFTVGMAGTVTRIAHHDLPGRREALAAFFDACGLKR
jgi:ketosteroid isomerase-like protein